MLLSRRFSKGKPMQLVMQSGCRCARQFMYVWLPPCACVSARDSFNSHLSYCWIEHDQCGDLLFSVVP